MRYRGSKRKIDDVITSFAWFDEEYFTHEPKHVLSKDEILAHGYRYHEHRIQNTQTIDLLIMYQKNSMRLSKDLKIEKRYLITIVWRLNQITHKLIIYQSKLIKYSIYIISFLFR